MAEERAKPAGLKALIAEPKGKLDFHEGEAVLLHVFWRSPSPEKAQKLLSGLQKCATATHRDTPCTPTYFFRICHSDSDLCPAPPATVGAHPELLAAKKRLAMGAPLPAVRAHIVRLGLDPALLDLPDDASLPAELRSQPVAVEFTEVYLDERAFMEHAGSRDYLEGYGVVMTPGMSYGVPLTFRLGTPCSTLVDKILEPILKEQVQSMTEGACIWRDSPAKAAAASETSSSIAEGLGKEGALFLSMDAQHVVPASVPEGSPIPVQALPAELRDACTTCVSFIHPYRPNTTRFMCVLPRVPSGGVLAQVAAALSVVRGEVHIPHPAGPKHVEETRAVFAAVGLSAITVNASECVGYALHEKSAAIVPKRTV